MRGKVVIDLKITVITVVVVLLGLVAFIKFDTPAAAEFTDNYLRPILGNGPVIALEKIFYNASDKVTQLTNKSSADYGPEFLDQGNASVISGSDLNLAPIYVKYNFTPIKNEGLWRNIPLNIFPGREVMAYTFVRPDSNRPYAYVTLVQVDMSSVNMAAVAGIKEPGGPAGKHGPGKVPAEIVQSGNLIAAFDGGFQYRDGQYGMIVGGITYLPLKNDLGTLVGYRNGTVKIINYTGQDLGASVAFVRQNCPILIENGTVSVEEPKNKKMWGRTLSADIYTYRSGVGIDTKGNLIYAVGNNLTPTTLAFALKMAGAVDAIQLDINPYWVRFNIFNRTVSGNYNTTTLAKNLQDGSKQYLNGYNKDFFYLYKKY